MKMQLTVNGEPLEVARVYRARMPRRVCYIEEMKGGKLQVTYSEGFCADLRHLTLESLPASE